MDKPWLSQYLVAMPGTLRAGLVAVVAEFRGEPLLKTHIGKVLCRELRDAAPANTGSPSPAERS